MLTKEFVQYILYYVAQKNFSRFFDSAIRGKVGVSIVIAANLNLDCYPVSDYSDTTE